MKFLQIPFNSFEYKKISKVFAVPFCHNHKSFQRLTAKGYARFSTAVRDFLLTTYFLGSQFEKVKCHAIVLDG